MKQGFPTPKHNAITTFKFSVILFSESQLSDSCATSTLKLHLTCGAHLSTEHAKNYIHTKSEDDSTY